MKKDNSQVIPRPTTMSIEAKMLDKNTDIVSIYFIAGFSVFVMLLVMYHFWLKKRYQQQVDDKVLSEDYKTDIVTLYEGKTIA